MRQVSLSAGVALKTADFFSDGQRSARHRAAVFSFTCGTVVVNGHDTISSALKVLQGRQKSKQDLKSS